MANTFELCFLVIVVILACYCIPFAEAQKLEEKPLENLVFHGRQVNNNTKLCPNNCTSTWQGVCNTGTGICNCNPDYDDPDCSYSKKSRLTAFLLSFFLGLWAADRFYLGYKWQPR
eukprot:TRINITY_DN4974_c0_g1_i4.p1 TRINITY_DN4974_c0_g1~~TRINITY_DN4974_c0_g1_i4.p1  ORF type:complete len:116 (-),score=31.96 TRINITY_DN4974_c0_g1_i4:390-737(-)